VVEVIARYPHTARWAVAIVGFEFLPDGFSKNLREHLDVLFGDEQIAGRE
jgi:hypothetical protein